MKHLKKTLIIASLMLFVTIKLFANTEDRHLSGFHAIQLSASYDVYITQGTTESVRVEAPDDVIDKIVTEVQGGVLKIYSKSNQGWSGSWMGEKKMVISITAKEITAIGISGSGNVYFKGGLNSNALKIKVSGSGDVTGKLNVKALEVGLTGSGDIKLTGHADNAAVSVSGSGDYSARDLVTITTAVRVSGSGDATVNASNKIDAVVSGSGDIRYTGGAKQVSTATHGSGDITRL
jgi:hypothetical protein